MLHTSVSAMELWVTKSAGFLSSDVPTTSACFFFGFGPSSVSLTWMKRKNKWDTAIKCSDWCYYTVVGKKQSVRRNSRKWQKNNGIFKLVIWFDLMWFDFDNLHTYSFGHLQSSYKEYIKIFNLLRNLILHCCWSSSYSNETFNVFEILGLSFKIYLLNTEYKCIMKITKLGRQHMKIGETFSHHPMVHTEWFNFIHASNCIFLCFWVW